MQAQVEARHRSEVDDVVDEARSRVRLLLGRLEQAPHSVELATSFNRAIAVLAKRPGPETCALLRELSELPVLRHARDAQGRPCRAAVIAAWLELGYPWALEVAPEDLEYVRSHAPGNAASWLTLTVVLTVTAALQNLGVVALVLKGAFTWQLLVALLLAVPPALVGLHAVALVRASRAGLITSRLRRLTRIEWLFPVVLAVLGNPDWSYRLGMLAWFAPHLLAWATARLAPRSDKPAD